MSIVNTLLLKMRYELGDMSGNLYSEYQLLDQYNKASAVLRQTILSSFPMQLAEEETGTVLAGAAITMLKKPVKFLDVRVDGDKIDCISLAEVSDKTLTGTPTAYYLLNTSTVKLYPLPDADYAYEIVYVPEGADKALTDDSGYQTDVEQLLVKYAVAMMIGKGFDLVAAYNASIGKMLGSMETGSTIANGYYSNSYRNSDY